MSERPVLDDDCPCAECDPDCDMVSRNEGEACDECQMGIHRPDRDED